MQKKLEKFGVTVHKKELKNGASLFLFERKGMPVYLRAAFFAGSRFDSIPGTAHFLEHMLLAGTKKFPTKNLLADYIQRIGGDFSASTDNNLLRFNIEISEAEDIDTGIELMTECLTNSLFNDQTIKIERDAIISELRSKKNNPKEYIAEVQRRVALQGTPAAHSTLGDESSIKNITRSNLVDYQKEFINSGRLSFIASGDISIESLKDKLDSINLESGEKFSIGGKLPIIREKDVEVEFYKGVDHLHVALVCRTNLEDYAEYCALMVLNSILAMGRSSRLITRLRYENGLVYTVASNVFNTIDWGTLRIKLSCDNSNLEKVKSLIFDEFNKLRQNNISSVELENIKSKISKGSIRSLQTSEAWVAFHENDALFFPSELHTVEDYISTINKLTLEDIKQVIDKYLLEEYFYVAICGDYKN
ncbi:MAG: pitrilysin family protein [bacterium]|nr:pitrilysin family protein [bacterium]